MSSGPVHHGGAFSFLWCGDRTEALQPTYFGASDGDGGVSAAAGPNARTLTPFGAASVSEQEASSRAT
jgi:hypothetical protein